jgi:hypothetical protein
VYTYVTAALNKCMEVLHIQYLIVLLYNQVYSTKTFNPVQLYLYWKDSDQITLNFPRALNLYLVPCVLEYTKFIGTKFSTRSTYSSVQLNVCRVNK